MDSNHPTTVLVVEDDASAGATAVAQIRALGWTAKLAASVDEARVQLSKGQVDMIVLDRMLGDFEDGLALLAWFKDMETTAPGVLVASHLTTPQDHIHALDLGADDYLDKPYDPAELGARLRALARRINGRRAPASVAIWSDLEVRTVNRTATWRGERIDLRPQSFDVLRELVAAGGEYVSRESLWRRVWDSYKNLAPQDTIINTALSRLRRSLASLQHAPKVQSDRLGIRLVPGE